MCKMKTPNMSAAAPMIAPDNSEAIRQGQIEDRLRRARRGAAANVLTSPLGIPNTPAMGKVAA